MTGVEWIPVSARLPVELAYVLIATGHGSTWLGQWTGKGWHYVKYVGSAEIAPPPLYWAPLPAGPWAP